MNKNDKYLKVELVGGPLCGNIENWPENTNYLIFEKCHARYDYEGLSEDGTKHTALYKGFSEKVI